MPVAVDTGQELGMLRDQVKRLKEHAEKLRKNDLELISAQRQAAEGKALVQKTKETWDNKVRLEQHEFAQKQQEEAHILQGRRAAYRRRLSGLMRFLRLAGADVGRIDLDDPTTHSELLRTPRTRRRAGVAQTGELDLVS